MMAGFTWTVPPQQAWSALAVDYHRRIERGIYAIAQKWTPQIANWMRANAPWTDRTAAARQSLWSDVNQEIGVMVEIIIAHGVEYGYYLEGWDPVNQREMQNAGEWAVVNPAIDHFAPLIWRDVVRMLS